jgi:hypothetical protein
MSMARRWHAPPRRAPALGGSKGADDVIVELPEGDQITVGEAGAEERRVTIVDRGDSGHPAIAAS